MDAGEVPLDDARSALNLGLGMLAVTRAATERELIAALTARGERVWRIGVVDAGERGVEWNDVTLGPRGRMGGMEEGRMERQTKDRGNGTGSGTAGRVGAMAESCGRGCRRSRTASCRC